MSALRHDLNNKLSSIRNSAFYLRRRSEKTQGGPPDDPRVRELFTVIDAELDACARLLAPTSLSTQSPDEREALGAVLLRLIAGLGLPRALELVIDPAVSSTDVSVQPSQLLEVALFALLEDAVADLPSGGQVQIGVRALTLGAWVDLEHPLSAAGTGTGTAPQPLRVAARLAEAWGGKLEALGGDGSARTSLWLPAGGQRSGRS
jgi:hypothetical protein